MKRKGCKFARVGVDQTLRRPSRHKAFATSACHPEHARVVVDVATYCSHLRARRSFAEKKRRLRRSEQNRRRRDLLRV